MKRKIYFIQVLLVLLSLGLATHLKDPHLLPWRVYEVPLLILIALIGFVLALGSVRTRFWIQLPLIVAWIVVLGITSYSEYRFRSQRDTVLSATSEYAKRLTTVGQHLVAGYQDPDELSELVRRGFIAGVFVTRRNAEGKTFEQLRMELDNFQILRRQAKLPPLIIATDQEGGAVSRLSPPLPRQPALASLLDTDLSDMQIEQNAKAYGIKQAKALMDLGINTNFSPVVDLKPDRESETLDFHTRIVDRAIAAEPAVVARVALAYSNGLLMQGVMPTVKHFPGLGSVADDTHHFSARLTLPLNELEQRDWYPFRSVLSQSPALLMVGHVIVDAVDPEYPASLSQKMLSGIVRENWKHDGILISDDMTMAAVYNRGLCESSIRSLNAGMDLLLVAYDWEKVYPVLECLQKAEESRQLENLEASRVRLRKMGSDLSVKRKKRD